MKARQSPRLELVARALAQAHAVHEHVVVLRSAERAVLELGTVTTRRVIHDETLQATVFRDLEDGRGSATFAVARGEEESLPELIAKAVSRAEQAVGMPWRMPLPAAPARVEVAEEFARHDPTRATDAVAEELLRLLDASLRLTELRVEAELASTELRSSRGFASSYDSTLLTIDGTITGERDTAGEAEQLRCSARRTGELRIADRVHAAAQQLRDRRAAVAPRPGEYDLLLTGSAVVGGPGQGHPADGRADYGWFGPVVAQSSATLARQGLTRYQPGQSIYPSAKASGDPLTLASDGTLPFGLLSQPFGDLGEPVRRFAIVSGGTAAGLALDMREAALRGVTPNGGIRNLSIGAGPTRLEELARPSSSRPLIEVRDLSWLQANPRTGSFVAELGLGFANEPATGLPGHDATTHTAPRAVVGGALTGNIFQLLSTAQFSAEQTTDGWYHGPAAIRLNAVTLR